MDKASRFLEAKPWVLRWVALDAPDLRDALAKYPWVSLVGPLKVIESVLRGIAQVMFVNNPLSGLIMLLGLLIGNLSAGVGAVAASLVAILVAKVLNFPDEVISAGLTNFSPVLVGTVIPALYPVFFHAPLSVPVWLYLLATSAFSVVVFAGLGNLLGLHKIPAYTLPFNVATSITFLCMRAAGYALPAPEAATASNDTSLLQGDEEEVEWDRVLMGTLLSVGQVWAVESVPCSVLILVGAFLCSPILTLACFLGGAIGTFTSLVVSSAPYSAVYSGVWGYNGFLAGGAIAFFMIPTGRNLFLASVNAVFATFIMAALLPVFVANQLPVFTFPFCLGSVLMLAATIAAAPENLVASPSTPELHLLHHHHQNHKQSNDKNIKMGVSESEGGVDDNTFTSPAREKRNVTITSSPKPRLERMNSTIPLVDTL
ncbi:hypothetical protein Pmani_038463 [Petrolisthes manimaculis]|uniref:Urea transporter n=1 Tax=Petrolisthes manimaculis TaxID=1843537 RepID=A0AAE1NED1_9EUCA|nr:hypothetical protein Pmani_038463 [Petrolisthes manimaculis]